MEPLAVKWTIWVKRRTSLTLPPCLGAEIVRFYTLAWYNAIFLRTLKLFFVNTNAVDVLTQRGKIITCIWLGNTHWVCAVQPDVILAGEWVSWSWLKHSIRITTRMKHETLLSQQRPDLKTLCSLADVQLWVRCNVLKGLAIVSFMWHWGIFQMDLPMFAFDSFQVQWHASLERPCCWRTWELTLFHRQRHPLCHLSTILRIDIEVFIFKSIIRNRWVHIATSAT